MGFQQSLGLLIIMVKDKIDVLLCVSADKTLAKDENMLCFAQALHNPIIFKTKLKTFLFS